MDTNSNEVGVLVSRPVGFECGSFVREVRKETDAYALNSAKTEVLLG